jgi:hypothetical protein
MIRNRVVQIEAAEPPIRQIEGHLLAKPPLRADAVAIADDEHADHQLGINRGAAGRAVIGRKLLVQTRKDRRDDRIYPAQQMLLRHAVLKPELVEQRALIRCLPSHHRRLPPNAPSAGISVRAGWQ